MNGLPNYESPINTRHPLNVGLVAWWLPGFHKNVRGGVCVPDLTRQYPGTLKRTTGTVDPTVNWVGQIHDMLSFGSIYYQASRTERVDTGFTQQLGDFACEVWFKDKINAGFMRVVDKSYQNGFWIGRDGALGGYGGGVLESAAPYGTYLTGFTGGIWNQLILSRVGSTKYLFGNGGRLSTTASCVTTLCDTSTFRIGTSNGAAPAGGDYWTGYIGSVRLYNRGITTAAEAQALYNEHVQHYPKLLNWLTPPRVTIAGGVNTTITVPIATLTLTKYAPVDKLSIVVPLKTLALTKYAPVDALSIVVPLKTFATTRYAPTIVTPVTVTPQTATLSVTKYAPTVALPKLVTIFTKTLTTSRFSPMIQVSGTEPALRITGSIDSLGMGIPVIGHGYRIGSGYTFGV